MSMEQLSKVFVFRTEYKGYFFDNDKYQQVIMHVELKI
jgi:hypothetical protein